MLLAWTIGSVAMAAAPTEALRAVDDGDQAFFSGHRAEGARSWRRARALADDTPEGHAAEAMARLRLMHEGPTIAALFAGPRIDRALAACASGPWCALAQVDYALLAPPGIGDAAAGLDLARGLAGDLPASAASRLALGGDLTALSALPADERDGLGTALASGHAWDPGPWLLGVGVAAGPSMGLGGALKVFTPDFARQGVAVDVGGFVATRGAGFELSARGSWAEVSAFAERSALWHANDPASYDRLWTVRVAPGVGHAVGKLRVDGGPELRWVGPIGDVVAMHGLWLNAAVDLRGKQGGGVWFGAEQQVASRLVADVDRYDVVGEARGYWPLGRVVVAGWLRGEGALGDAPDFLLPTIGGPCVFRGARPGVLRAPWTVVATAEARVHVVGPLELAAFAEGADVAGLHIGGGGGVRVLLPPVPHATLRVDGAYTDVGGSLYVAWGEAF